MKLKRKALCGVREARTFVFRCLGKSWLFSCRDVSRVTNCTRQRRIRVVIERVASISGRHVADTDEVHEENTWSGIRRRRCRVRAKKSRTDGGKDDGRKTEEGKGWRAVTVDAVNTLTGHHRHRGTIQKESIGKDSSTI